MKKTRLDFGKLPLLEAAVRASLTSPVALSYAIVGAIGRDLEPGFPAIAEPTQIEVVPGGPSKFELGIGTLPGAVFAGHEKGLMVSVHPQVVISRWLRQFGPQEKPYPRFSLLSETLWKTVDALGRAAGKDLPPLAVVNMSYVNFVREPHSAAGIRHYLSGRAQLGVMEGARQTRKLEAAWGEPDGIDLRFSVEEVSAKLGDEVIDGYRLTTAAGKRLAGTVNARTDLESIHERLQSFFLELISDSAKQDWQLQVVDRA
jgi:hypothetical protein